MSTQTAPPARETEKKYLAFFCSHTHWDREWYGSFQQYRFRLVRLIDYLMEILEKDPDYRCFNLDGQTVVLEDYLEVKPEQRPRLERFIREGRIAIGPWYILPDEWLVSGESTIRNLLRGRAICREFGVEGSKVGYLPDMFGHLSQIPQLLRGFGLDNTIFWRGLSGDQYMSELWWESPDGTRVLGFHLPEYCGYGNAAFFYHSLPEEARTLDDETPPWKMVSDDTEFASSALRAVADRLIAKSRSNRLLFLNGVDHMEPQPQTPEIIRKANEKLENVEIRHATFEEFMTELKQACPEDLQVVRGEHRSAPVAKGSGAIVLPNILSSRIYLKIANARSQTLLERWSEPFSSVAAWVGQEYPAGFLNTAWKWLLRNHPHDSIGGCSIDDVHRQMETRFEWAEDIAWTVASNSIYQITQAISTEELPENQAAWFLFNPLNWKVDDLVVLDVDVDGDWLTKNGVVLDGHAIASSIRNLKIFEWDGAPAQYEILDIIHLSQHRPWMRVFGPVYSTVRFKIALAVRDLPAFGYKGYKLAVAEKPRRLGHRPIIAAPNRMANEHLTIEVNPNGTLNLSGAALGKQKLEGLHYFLDGGDNGDGYTYSPPRFDSLVTSLGSNAQISRTVDTPNLQEITVDYELSVPESVTHDRQHRSAETVPLKIRSKFRLGPNSRRVDVETTLTNIARDHRLQICFPVHGAGDTHFAESQFDIVERANCVVQPDEEVWMEDMPLEMPQQAFVSCSNLAVANFGVPEYELSPGDPSLLKLTLLRAVNYLGAGLYPNTITSGAGPHIETPDQQMLGRSFTYHYSIIPHSGDLADGRVQREAHQHNALWRGMASGRHPGFLPADRLSFVEVSGDNIVLSAVKQVDAKPGNYIVRFWNSGSKNVSAQVSWFRKPVAAYISNLAEEKLDELAVSGEAIAQVEVSPKQIKTVRFQMAESE